MVVGGPGVPAPAQHRRHRVTPRPRMERMTERGEVPRYEITHDGITAEAVVVQVGGKTIVQPIEPVIVPAGESFTISGEVTISGD